MKGCSHANVTDGTKCGGANTCKAGRSESSCDSSKNLALSATRKTNVSGAGCYTEANLNDNKTQAQGENGWAWWSTHSTKPNTGKYAEYSWSTAQRLGRVVVDTTRIR